MSIDPPKLALIALILLIVLPVALKIVTQLIARGVGRMFLTALGRHALLQQPDTVELRRDGAGSWRDAARIEALSNPLLKSGFADVGIYVTDKMPGMRIWFLLNEETRTAAFVYDHPKAAPWVELSVRYNDGTTTALSNLPPTGINLNPPFYRRIVVGPATPTDQMYQRLLRERSQFGIKSVTPQTVVPEFEDAYAHIMVWQKNKGLTPEEVAAVVKKWAAQRQQATGGRP